MLRQYSKNKKKKARAIEKRLPKYLKVHKMHNRSIHDTKNNSKRGKGIEGLDGSLPGQGKGFGVRGEG